MRANKRHKLYVHVQKRSATRSNPAEILQSRKIKVVFPPNLLNLCSNVLQTSIIYCLVNFSIIALQTLSIYCLKNTSFALLHTLHQALLPHHKTLAVLLVVKGGCCLVGTNIRAVRFEIFRTERGERQSRRLLIRQAKKKNLKISAIRHGY